jgi:hypothetical protein
VIPEPLDVLAIGVVSPLGAGAAAHVTPWPEQPPDTGGVRVVGPIDVRPLLGSPKTEKFLTREMVLCLAAADQVRRDLTGVPAERVGVVLATAPPIATLLDLERLFRVCVVGDVLDTARLAADLSLVVPVTWPARSIKAMTACHLAAEMGWLGPNMTLAPRGFAGLNVLDAAAMMLEADEATVVVVGAAESCTDPVNVGRYKRAAAEGLVLADRGCLSEGAVLLALASPGRGGSVVGRILARQEFGFDPDRDWSAQLASAAAEFVAALGRGSRPSDVWIDADPQLADRIAERLPPYTDTRRVYGYCGVASPTLALASAFAAPAREPGELRVVFAASPEGLFAVAVGGPV